MQFVILVLLFGTVSCFHIEPELKQCAKETNITDDVLDDLTSFSIETPTEEQKDWMVCAVKYYVLGNDSKLLPEEQLREKFTRHSGKVDFLIDALKKAKYSDDPKKYAVELYKALEYFSLNYSVLKCKNGSSVDIRTIRHLMRFNSSNVNIAHEEIKFIECYLREIGVISNNSKLNDDAVVKRSLMKKLPDVEEDLLGKLHSVKMGNDRHQYALKLFKEIEEYKDNRFAKNSAWKIGSTFVLSINLFCLVLIL